MTKATPMARGIRHIRHIRHTPDGQSYQTHLLGGGFDGQWDKQGQASRREASVLGLDGFGKLSGQLWFSKD